MIKNGSGGCSVCCNSYATKQCKGKKSKMPHWEGRRIYRLTSNFLLISSNKLPNSFSLTELQTLTFNIMHFQHYYIPIFSQSFVYTSLTVPLSAQYTRIRIIKLLGWLHNDDTILIYILLIDPVAAIVSTNRPPITSLVCVSLC